VSGSDPFHLEDDSDFTAPRTSAGARSFPPTTLPRRPHQRQRSFQWKGFCSSDSGPFSGRVQSLNSRVDGFPRVGAAGFRLLSVEGFLLRLGARVWSKSAGGKGFLLRLGARVWSKSAGGKGFLLQRQRLISVESFLLQRQRLLSSHHQRRPTLNEAHFLEPHQRRPTLNPTSGSRLQRHTPPATGPDLLLPHQRPETQTNPEARGARS
jgi:hypothetical protein